MSEMGEFLVGAYLREVLDCEIVVYNQRLSREKGEFSEVDVLGFDAEGRSMYLCEVVTHLQGANYKNYLETVRRLRAKFKSARDYARRAFPRLKARYMFWSPKVASGLLHRISQIGPSLGIKIEMLVKTAYAEKLDELCVKARRDKRNTGNPFYRTLQIIETSKIRKV